MNFIDMIIQPGLAAEADVADVIRALPVTLRGYLEECIKLNVPPNYVLPHIFMALHIATVESDVLKSVNDAATLWRQGKGRGN